MVVTLSNGIKLVLEKMPYVRSISFGIWVKNGSRNEMESTNGISHFIEHMLFKGTEKRSAQDIAYEMDSIGGQINAYTSKEVTCYYTKSLDEHFDIALDVFADMFLNSKFDEIEIEKEKNVILEEIGMYEDTPDEVAYDLLNFNVWKDCSLRFPIIGTEKNVSNFTRKDFKDYYNDKYTPQNTVISVAGNFDIEEMTQKIESHFGKFKNDKIESQVGQPTKYKACVVQKEKDIEQVHLVAGFSGLDIKSEELYTMSVFNTVFGGGMSSRLFQKIREDHGLAYSVYSTHSSYEDAGLFSIYAGLSKNNVESVLNHIVNEIKGLYTDKITTDQLERTKNQIKSGYLLNLESSSSRMSSIGRSQIMLNRVLSPDEVIEKIDKITIDRLYNVISQVLDLNSMSLSIVGDINGLNVEEMLKNAR